VIGSFSANQLHFHDVSGEGYRLLGETIQRLDPINGQIAARMVSPLGQWRRVDPGRQVLMRAALEKIVAQKGLSKGTYEMASKSLA
jgi:aminopeptidase N